VNWDNKSVQQLGYGLENWGIRIQFLSKAEIFFFATRGSFYRNKYAKQEGNHLNE
jgi:hypothetical protein